MFTIAFDPVITRIGSFELGWHGVATVCAVVVAVWLAFRAAPRAGMPLEVAERVATSAVVAGIIGARLFHVLDHLPTYLADPLSIFAIWSGGIAAYGAFIGGIAGGVLAARRLAFPVWRGLDIAAIPMLVGQALGRLGCLANGDAWGAPTGGSWGVVYTHPNDLLPRELLGVPTHPYPLYEIVADLALLAILFLLWRRRPEEGVVFCVAAIGYALIRFSLSFVRQEAVLFAGLQEAQLTAIITAVIASVLLARTLAHRRAVVSDSLG